MQFIPDVPSDQFSTDFIIAAMISSLTKLAEIHNATRETVFNNDVANAKLNNATPPTSYKVEVVHPDAIKNTYAQGIIGDWNTSGWVTFEDFTPPAPPPPPAIPVPTVPVGGSAGGDWYLDTGATGYGDGAKWTDSRGTFQKVQKATPFGVSVGWLKIA